MSSAITVVGQTRINQLRGEEKPLVIDRMVLALVPDLDPTQPVDRNQQMPDPAHIVHTYDIPAEFKGYVNPDQVVYSMILGSDVGDFSFNWIGTLEAVTGTVITVTTTPETPKRKTDLARNTTGNNITRNVMMQFQDAQALTGVSVSAETWQFDYTTWMTAKIEEHDGDGGAHGDIRDEITTQQDALALLKNQLGSAAYRELLGIVSQADGVPTGAIIEHQETSSGNYTRWADGTQICTGLLELNPIPINTALAGVYRSGRIFHNLPASFVDYASAKVKFSWEGGAGADVSLWFGQENFAGNSTIGTYLLSGVSKTTGEYTRIGFFAIGRWY